MRSALYPLMTKHATVFSEKITAITAADFAIVRPPENQSMPRESDNPLSEYVRSVMLENGLSADAVAKMSKRRGGTIGRSTIQQIVQGKTPNPGIHTLKELAWGINRPLEELLARALGKQIGEIHNAAAQDFATLA